MQTTPGDTRLRLAALGLGLAAAIIIWPVTAIAAFMLFGATAPIHSPTDVEGFYLFVPLAAMYFAAIPSLLWGLVVMGFGAYLALGWQPGRVRLYKFIVAFGLFLCWAWPITVFPITSGDSRERFMGALCIGIALVSFILALLLQSLVLVILRRLKPAEVKLVTSTSDKAAA